MLPMRLPSSLYRRRRRSFISADGWMTILSTIAVTMAVVLIILGVRA